MLLIGKLTNKPTPNDALPNVRQRMMKEPSQAPNLHRGPVLAVWWRHRYGLSGSYAQATIGNWFELGVRFDF